MIQKKCRPGKSLLNFLFLSLLLNQNMLLLAKKSTPTINDSSRRIQLPEDTYEKLLADSPATQIKMGTDHSVWIAGQQYIWRWQYQLNRLQKLRFRNPQEKEPVKGLTLGHEKIYIGTDKKVHRVNLYPLKVKTYEIDAKGDLISLNSKNDLVYMTRTNGVYIIDDKIEKIIKHLPFATKTKSKSLYIPDRETLWSAQDTTLLQQFIDQGTPKKRTLISLKTPFRGIVPDGEHILAYTPYAILRYNLEARVVQTIPVEGNHKLVSMATEKGYHTYLFSDRVLEKYDLKQEKTKHFYLDIGLAKKITSMSTRKSDVALLLDGKPSIYQLSGKW